MTNRAQLIDAWTGYSLASKRWHEARLSVKSGDPITYIADGETVEGQIAGYDPKMVLVKKNGSETLWERYIAWDALMGAWSEDRLPVAHPYRATGGNWE